MTFSDIQARLNIGVLRADLQPFYGEYINEALREIQNRRSWTVMKTQATLTIPGGSGYESVVLVSGFKELRRTPAIFWIDPISGIRVPADVVFEAQQISRQWVWSGAATVGNVPPPSFLPTSIFVNTIPGGARIGTVYALDQPFSIFVLYFQYLPDLVNPTDTSPFIDAYPQMVLAKARAIALSEINDEESQKSEVIFENKYIAAMRQDAHSEVAGHVLHMGQGSRNS